MSSHMPESPVHILTSWCPYICFKYEMLETKRVIILHERAQSISFSKELEIKWKPEQQIEEVLEQPFFLLQFPTWIHDRIADDTLRKNTMSA